MRGVVNTVAMCFPQIAKTPADKNSHMVTMIGAQDPVVVEDPVFQDHRLEHAEDDGADGKKRCKEQTGDPERLPTICR